MVNPTPKIIVFTALFGAFWLWTTAKAPAAQLPPSFRFDNFNDISSLQLNGPASRAVTGDGPVLQLTSSGGGSTHSGSVFSSAPISLTSSAGFTTMFMFRLANSSAGTDDVAFTVQGDSAADLGSNAIPNSLSVEFDAATEGDNQIVIKTNGVATGAAAPAPTALNNGALWYAWVDYEGASQDLEIRLSQTPVRPYLPNLDTTVNVAAIVGTNLATSATFSTNNLLVNGGFENEPNWGHGIGVQDSGETEMTGSQIPGWTIDPNHAATVHVHPGSYLVISGKYSVNTDGEGYDNNNASFYQDFNTVSNLNYQLSFNWQSWPTYVHVTSSQLQVSLTNAVTGNKLFDGLYSYDGPAAPLHAVTANFTGTGDPVRLRINQTPQDGINDNMYVVDNFAVAAASPTYANAFVGFTGTGGNQQDIVAWRFTALPSSRITGTLNMTNLPAGFQMTNSMVMMQYMFDLDGITITQYVWVPVVVSGTGPATMTFQSSPANLPPSDDGDTNGPYQDENDWTMCSGYTSSLSTSQGVVLSTYNNGDYPNSLDNYFDTVLPSDIDEPTFTGLLGVQSSSNLPPDLVQGGIIGKLTSTNNVQVFFPRNQAGVFTGWTTLYSQGVFAGSMTARQQILASSPAAPLMESPRVSGGNFLFDFSTVQNQSYTVWAGASLTSTNWASYTNLISDGYVQEIAVPLGTNQQNYFRLTSP